MLKRILSWLFTPSPIIRHDVVTHKVHGGTFYVSDAYDTDSGRMLEFYDRPTGPHPAEDYERDEDHWDYGL